MVYIIVCGGTAGHINPGIAIAEEIRSRLPESEILFIGADRDMEKRLIPEAGFELQNIKMSGIKRSIKPKDIAYNIKTVINLASAGRKARRTLRERKPRAVIGTGGYICYPILKAAVKQKIPTFVHESNACPGMTVKMLSGLVDKVITTYPGYEKYYKKPDRIVQLGTPLRKGFYESLNEIQDIQAENNEDDSCRIATASQKFTVLSFWGSLGAERMNEVMAGFIKRNIDSEDFNHIHAAGNSKAVLIGKLAELGITHEKLPYTQLREYIDDMPVQMKKADLVLCRAGGITITELAALGKPSIIIPSPYVPDNVQHENAKQLQQAGAAIVINETECTADLLYDTVRRLSENRGELKKMSDAAKMLSTPTATTDIVDLIMGSKSIASNK